MFTFHSARQKDDVVLLNGKSQQFPYNRKSVLARSSILKDECIFYLNAADSLKQSCPAPWYNIILVLPFPH